LMTWPRPTCGDKPVRKSRGADPRP
jgi:hypothetical protein